MVPVDLCVLWVHHEVGLTMNMGCCQIPNLSIFFPATGHTVASFFYILVFFFMRRILAFVFIVFICQAGFVVASLEASGNN